MFRGGDPERPDDGTWWFPPGGGVEVGETDGEAAVRELREETGLSIEDVGVPIAQRRAVFSFEGRILDSDEVYFLVRVDRFEPDVSGWTALEQRTIVEYRWWSQADIATTDEVVYPERLLSMVDGSCG